MMENIYITIHQSPPDEISKDGCVVAIESSWLYIADTLPELLELISKEWRSDNHLVG